MEITAENVFKIAQCFATSPKFGQLIEFFSNPQIKKCDGTIAGNEVTDSVLQLPEIRIDVDDRTCGQLTLTCSTDAVEDDEVNLLIVIFKLNYNNNNNK